jgi:tetratricopeptide (TPR) repeat protein
MALERPARWSRRGERFMKWAALGLAALLAVLLDWPHDRCATLQGTSSTILRVCSREYQVTRDPRTGIRYADQLRKLEQRDAARALAGALVLSSAAPEAWRVLGQLALADDDLDVAVHTLEVSRRQSLARQKLSSAARADQVLIGVLSNRDQFVEALQAADRCIEHARAGGDRQVESYCHLSAAQTLIAVGYVELVRQELDAAAGLATSRRDRAWLQYQRAHFDQEVEREPLRVGHHRQAVERYERLLSPAWIDEVPDLVLSIELNLAYSLVEIGRFDDAAHHLWIVQLLDVTNRNELRRKQIAARIAFRRGDLARAAALNDQIYDGADHQDQQLEIATLQARIALQRGDLSGAERWAARGIAQVEALRAAQSALELRPWVLSSRRAAYELRFTALARAGRIEDAVMAFDQWQGRTMLDALARRVGTPSNLSDAAGLTQQRVRWLPTVSAAPHAEAADRRAVLDRLRTIDVFALILADGDLWRLTAIAGTLQLDNLGPHAQLRDRLDRFTVESTEQALATELGALLMPDALFRPTTSPLRVLLDGPLGALPVVALRSTDGPLIAARPVIRVPRLPAAACVPAATPTHATVLADVEGDLPAARREVGPIVTALELDARVSVGSEATSDALFATPAHGLVHVGVHAEVGVGGGMLKLHDRGVSALEITSRGLGPRLVVLAACGSASSNDAELAGSLATAFLAAGSAQVIATLRAVSDEAASSLTTRFYRAGGLADPVRVLAMVQAELARTSNTAWPSFAVFGHEACSPTH